MKKILSIPNTLRIVDECWKAAEKDLRASIETKHHDLDEEVITKLFYGEFRFALNRASEKRLISTVFLKDLRRAFPSFATSSGFKTIAENLVADVSLHSRKREGITGGDFGFTITRPQVSVTGFSPYHTTPFVGDNRPKILTSEHQFGLLVQAKLKGRTGKWGRFKPNQVKVLPEHMEYLALLLYQYNDKERKKLNTFNWQICSNVSIEDAKRWLKLGEFPSLIKSSSLINHLGTGKIGTDDSKTLDKVIQPTGKPRFSIMISWPPGKKPSSEIEIEPWLIKRTKMLQKQKVQVTNR